MKLGPFKIRKSTVRRTLFLLIALISIYTVQQGGIAGDGATQAIARDGDSLTLGKVQVRLWGVDAPELSQTCEAAEKIYPCGEKARAALREIIKDKTVTCAVVEQDKYGRNVARCQADGADIGLQMVRQGWALDYTHYSGGAYKLAETQARAEKAGIWSGTFQQPHVYRRSHPAYSEK